MASFIHANRDDLLCLAKALGLNSDPAWTKKAMVPLLQGEMKKRMEILEQFSAPPEDAPILPVIGGSSGDAPPPPNERKSDGGEGSDDDHEELDEDPEQDPIEPEDDEEFLIHIFMENRPHVSLQARSTDTISIVKVHLQHLVGVRRRDQRLRFLGGLGDLEDHRTLSFYNITEGNVLEMTIRARGGGKRLRSEVPDKRFVLAQLHGGIELLLQQATDEVRAEYRNLDTNFRTWNFLDDIPYATLEPIVRKILAMNYNLTERRVAEVFQPQMTRLVEVLRQRISSLEKEVDLLFHQCTLKVTRLVMADDGVCDWKALRSVLQSKLDRRLGMEAAALAANAVIVPAPPA